MSRVLFRFITIKQSNDIIDSFGKTIRNLTIADYVTHEPFSFLTVASLNIISNYTRRCITVVITWKCTNYARAHDYTIVSF